MTALLTQYFFRFLESYTFLAHHDRAFRSLKIICRSFHIVARALVLAFVLVSFNLVSAFSYAEESPYLPSRERLEKLLYDYFGDPADRKSTKPLSLEELKDKNVFDTLWEIYYQIESCLDAGISLQSLDGYGIVVTGENQIQIDKLRNPHWNLIYDIVPFRSDGEQYLKDHIPEFIEKGFTQSDLEKLLENYHNRSIDTYRDTQMKVSRRAIQMYYLPLIQSEETSRTEDITLLREVKYKNRKAEYDARREVVLKVLDNLDERTQKILVYTLRDSRDFDSVTIKGIVSDTDGINDNLNEVLALDLEKYFMELK